MAHIDPLTLQDMKFHYEYEKENQFHRFEQKFVEEGPRALRTFYRDPAENAVTDLLINLKNAIDAFEAEEPKPTKRRLFKK